MHLFTFLCRVTQGISYKEQQTEGTQTSSLTFQFNTFNSYPLLWNKSQLLTLTFTSLHALSPSGHSNIPPPPTFSSTQHITEVEIFDISQNILISFGVCHYKQDWLGTCSHGTYFSSSSYKKQVLHGFISLGI